MRSVDDLLAEGVSGRRVLLRADLNVPLDKSTGAITDDGRIRASLPTLQALRDAGARVIVAAHLGRPKGAPDPQFSLAPVAARLGELLGAPVPLAADVGGRRRAAKPRPRLGTATSAAGERPLRGRRDVEGRRRAGRAGRPAGRPRRRLRRRRVRRRAPQARLGVRRGRAAAALRGPPGRPRARRPDPADHRPRAALRGRARRLEGQRQAGRDRGAAAQGRPAAHRRRHVLHVPRRPGPRRRQLAAGGRPGRHLPPLLAEAGDKIVLPVDVVCADRVRRRRRDQRVPADAIPDDLMGLDVGPLTVELFAAELAEARTVFWNGPMGVFELAPFQEGTRGVAAGGRRASTGCPSSAAATPPPPSGSSASTRRPTATSAPAAARRWSTSRAGNCRASRCSPTEQERTWHARTARRQARGRRR